MVTLRDTLPLPQGSAWVTPTHTVHGEGVSAPLSFPRSLLFHPPNTEISLEVGQESKVRASSPKVPLLSSILETPGGCHLLPLLRTELGCAH